MKNNNGQWIKGLSWTSGRWATTTNPDRTTMTLYISAGLFYYNPHLFWNKFCLHFGAKPTPPWGEGYGNEGLFPFIHRWLKRHGWGNYGFVFVRNK